VRLDETEIPGVLPTIGYLRWPPEDEESVAAAVLTKLGRLPEGLAGLSTGTGTIRRPEVTPANRSRSDLYCRTCGAVPGKPTECTVGYSHNFTPTTAPLYCRTCGAVPGAPTTCSVGYSHSFIPLTGPTHCRTCGAVPGSATQCTVGYSHSFVRA
jgi:hypothetical protein